MSTYFYLFLAWTNFWVRKEVGGAVVIYFWSIPIVYNTSILKEHQFLAILGDDTNFWAGQKVSEVDRIFFFDFLKSAFHGFSDGNRHNHIQWTLAVIFGPWANTWTRQDRSSPSFFLALWNLLSLGFLMVNSSVRSFSGPGPIFGQGKKWMG